MTIADLLRAGSGHADAVPVVQRDPFRGGDLPEAQLLSVRLDALAMTAGFLLALRSVPGLDDGGTAVIVARGVQELTCSLEERSTRPSPWVLVGGVVLVSGDLIRYESDLLPGKNGFFGFAATRAEFYVGSAPTSADEPTSWSSPFVLTAATVRDAGSPEQ